MDMQSRERQFKRRQQRLQRSVVQLPREVAALERCIEQQERSEEVRHFTYYCCCCCCFRHCIAICQCGVADAHFQCTGPGRHNPAHGEHMMFRAAPQWVRQALALRVSDISRLLTNTFYELLALLEFESRTRAEPAAAASTVAAGVPDLGGSPAPPPGCCQSDASAAGQPQDNSAQAQQQAAAAAGAQHLQADAQPPAPQLSYSADLRRLVDRFFGLVTIILVLQPLPLFGAATCNHREQQQGTPPAQHWMVRAKLPHMAWLSTAAGLGENAQS